MLGMLKRHEFEILLKAGHPKTEVARLSGVSLRSVKRIAEESPVVHVDDGAERSKHSTTCPRGRMGGIFNILVLGFQETENANRHTGSGIKSVPKRTRSEYCRKKMREE